MESEVHIMRRLVLDVLDDRKAEALLTLIHDLDYVKAREDSHEKIWTGYLPVFDNPVHVEDFKMFTREELHER